MPFIPFQYIASTSSGVNEEDGTVVQGESCQVRATSGEGLEAALGGVDLWDGSNDEKVGGKNKHDESDDIGGKYKIQPGSYTSYYRQTFQREQITEKIINDLLATEAQGKCFAGDDYWVNKATDIWSCNKTVHNLGDKAWE